MFKLLVMKNKRQKAIPSAWRDVSDLFVALGDEQRQRILLNFKPGERLNVSEIVSTSTLSRTAVSHHLKILKQAGALQTEKIGKEVYFWIDKRNILQQLQRVMTYVRNSV